MSDDRKLISMKVPFGLLAEIDRAAGKGNRTGWLLDAARARLAYPVEIEFAGEGPTPVGQAKSLEGEQASIPVPQAEPSPSPAPSGCEHVWVSIVGRNRCQVCGVWKH